MKKILIDNGHGKETPGKRSPDGRLLEYAYTREIAGRIVGDLKARGIDSELLTPEQEDVSLGERCARANKWCEKIGAGNVALVSIHCNAAGMGEWKEARGWEAWTSRGNTEADRLAECMYEAASSQGLKIRRDLSDGDSDKESGLYILRHTLCPAVLTENLFQDNREDVDFLLSEAGKEAVIRLHVDGICRWLSE